MLKVKEIPVDKTNKHPKVDEILLQHEFTLGIIAPKGSGKTTLMCNLLQFYKNFFNAIYIFSPTVKNDEKWDWVKKQNLITENTKLINFFKSLDDDYEEDPIVGNKRKRRSDAFIETYCNTDRIDGKFDGRIKEECFYHDYTEEDLVEIIKHQQSLVDLLKEHGKTRHLANRILIICDDLVGSSLFSNHRKNPFKMLNANHRHLSTSIMLVSQAFKEIQKAVRTQFSALILFEISSDNEIKVICEEFPMGLKTDEWYEVYQYCTKDDFSFLFYNMQRKKKFRLMKNFTEYIEIGKYHHRYHFVQERYPNHIVFPSHLLRYRRCHNLNNNDKTHLHHTHVRSLNGGELVKYLKACF